MGRRARRGGQAHASRSKGERPLREGEVRQHRMGPRKATVYLHDGAVCVDFTPALDLPDDEIPAYWRKAVRKYPELPARFRPEATMTRNQRAGHARQQKLRQQLRRMAGQEGEE